MPIARIVLPILLALTLVAAPATAGSGEPEARAAVGDRVFDAAVLRPLGAVGTAVGFAMFVCSLPLAGPTLQVGEAWESFVLKPVDYTFERELGDF